MWIGNGFFLDVPLRAEEQTRLNLKGRHLRRQALPDDSSANRAGPGGVKLNRRARLASRWRSILILGQRQTTRVAARSRSDDQEQDRPKEIASLHF
jgi:hypothetical protein